MTVKENTKIDSSLSFSQPIKNKKKEEKKSLKNGTFIFLGLAKTPFVRRKADRNPKAVCENALPGTISHT